MPKQHSPCQAPSCSAFSGLRMPPPDDNSLRTTGGNWRWEPPAPAEVQRMLPQYEVEKLIGRGVGDLIPTRPGVTASVVSVV